MRVLVTGHKGFIGQNLVQYINDNTDWNVNLYDWDDGNMPSVMEQDWIIHLGAISSTTERDLDKIMVSQFSRQAESGKIKLFHNSDSYLRDFIAVEDVCRTHVEFIKQVKESGVWNVGTGNAVSFEHVAQLIAKKTNAQIEYIDMPEILKQGYQAYTCADLTKLTATIGPQQWITVEDWLNS